MAHLMATWYSCEGHTVRATLYATNGNTVNNFMEGRSEWQHGIHVKDILLGPHCMQLMATW